ncbi:MAG: heparinase II/III family protein [Candidatus Ornithomonoglobus sp.]
MTNKERLHSLISEAEGLLSDNSGLYTEGWRAELARMTELAKKALGGAEVPFIRSRAFYEPREDDAVLHAEKYFSRAPSYESEFYGLAPAIESFKNSRADLRIDELRAAVRRYRAELDAADTAGGMGSFDKTESEKTGLAIDKAMRAEGKKGEAELLVKACDEMRYFKSTRIFRQDIEADSNLFLTDEGKKRLLSAIESDVETADIFKLIKAASDLYSPERAELLGGFLTTDTDYDKINRHFFVWSTTDKVITFHTPENARYASLRFVLPEEENECGGLGHVWIDNVRVCTQSGGDWEIKNSGFDDVINGIVRSWKPVVLKGKPSLKSVTEYPYRGEGNASVYIKNPTSGDSGAWEYGELIPLEGDTENTVIFLAKIDGKFKKGLKIEIEFYDAERKRIGEFHHFYNRKSVLREENPALTMQADAIMYYITGDKLYAKKAEKEFLYALCDFCQGTETWFAYDKRPDGCDAYGAVQGGRIMCSLMSTYTFIKDAVDLRSEEWVRAMQQLEYLASYLYDGRPRAEMTPEAVQSYAGNWQTDMACGIGFLVMAMPKTEKSAIILDNVNYFLKSQLLINLGKDGSWPESIRYHFATLTRFAVYARVLKHVTGEDWFRDMPLADMFYYPIMMQTPPYEYMGGHISTPSIGDHIMKNGEDFALFGIYAADVYAVNPEIGALMYNTWKKAGCPAPKLGAEEVVMAALLRDDTNIEECEAELKSTGYFKDAGIYIMRTESDYCAIAAPRRNIGHGHYDAGSMIIYKNNIPVVIDPGIEGYFDSTKDWYVSSSAHSVMQFERAGGKKLNPDPFDINLEKTEYSAVCGWEDTARITEPLEFVSDDKEDIFSVRIKNSSGRGVHTRTIRLLKAEGCYKIDDRTEDFDGQLRFSLVTAMKDAVIEGRKVHCTGYFDVDMDVEFIGEVQSITIENGRVTDQFPHCGTPYAKIIRAEGRNGFTVTVRPYKNCESCLDNS